MNQKGTFVTSGLFVFVVLNLLLQTIPVSSSPISSGDAVLPYGNGTDAYDDRTFFLQPIKNISNAATCATSSACCRYRCAAIPPGGTGGELASECATGAVPGSAAGRCITGGGIAASLAPGSLCVFSLTCPACFDYNAVIACVGQPECTRVLGNAICPYT